jgi:hypothetical protein
MEDTTQTHQRKQKPAEDHPERVPALIQVHPFSFAFPLPTSILFGRNLLNGKEWFGLSFSRLKDNFLQMVNTYGQTTWNHLIETISRKQVRLFFEGDDLWVEDLGSKNGSWINGTDRIASGQKKKIENWSVLRLGDLLFFYHPALEKNLLGEGRPPLGDMVGPWGLWELEQELDFLDKQPRRSFLLIGPSGSGKELLAKEIAARVRKGRPCHFWNIAAGPETTFEAQLFGYEKGAFTGAINSSPGVIRAADQGVVVLDEIGELPLDLQAKLLRFLENGEVQPVGATKPVKVDVICILSTHQDLHELVQQGKFREDLLARIELPCLQLPSLEVRRSDLLSIANEILRQIQPGSSMNVDVAEFLMLASWPRNVRQLRSLLMYALDKNGQLDQDRLVRAYKTSQQSSQKSVRANPSDSAEVLKPTQEEKDFPQELHEVLKELKEFNNNKTRYAESYNKSPGAFAAHCKKMGFWQEIKEKTGGKPGRPRKGR